MVLEQWFPTPIWYGTFDNVSETHYTFAIKYCKELAVKTLGRTVSNNDGGWQSGDLFYYDIHNTPLQEFFNKIKPNIKTAFLDLGVTDNLEIVNFWININYKNCSNQPHYHPGGSLSGVFYLTSNNASIVFERNKDIGGYHMSWINSKKNTPLSFDSIKYTPTRGQFLIFPSWLVHSVEPNTNKEERISIAFNIGTTHKYD